jgi:hypothetical protein
MQAGSTIGLNESDNGQIGESWNDLTSFYTIGPPAERL